MHDTKKFTDGFITETLVSHDDDSYSYTVDGIIDVNDYQGKFSVTDSEDGEHVMLEWKVSFKGLLAGAMITVLSLIGSAGEQMTTSMTSHFSPDA